MLSDSKKRPESPVKGYKVYEILQQGGKELHAAVYSERRLDCKQMW